MVTVSLQSVNWLLSRDVNPSYTRNSLEWWLLFIFNSVVNKLHCPQMLQFVIYRFYKLQHTLVHIFAQTNHTSAGAMYAGSSVASCDYDMFP